MTTLFMHSSFVIPTNKSRTCFKCKQPTEEYAYLYESLSEAPKVICPACDNRVIKCVNLK